MNKKQTNIEKGTEYELFINNSLNNLEGNISWLWSKIPELELRKAEILGDWNEYRFCLLYTSPSPRDRTRSRMPSSA